MFKLEINTDNAAFVANDEELADVLRELAHKLQYNVDEPPDTGLIRDSNGNTVGAWSWL